MQVGSLVRASIIRKPSVRDWVSLLVAPGIAAGLLVSVADHALAAEKKAVAPLKPTVAQVIAGALESEWRDLDPQNTLVMELPTGEVIIELAPRFAPKHVENLRIFAREHYFDGLKIIRSQDNYVTQWGDPFSDDPEKIRSLGGATGKLPAEISVPLKSIPLVRMRDRDAWAKITGFVDAMPVAADPTTKIAWPVHCYGVVGAGRDMPVDSSNASSLYVVIGHSPRGLDRNITVVGRVIKGMEHLSALPRGTAPMGFYASAAEMKPIHRVRLLADIPLQERPELQVLRSESESWQALLQALRVRQEEWFVASANHVGICNVTVPTRKRPPLPK
jgi:peptidylprolyl isomerase